MNWAHFAIQQLVEGKRATINPRGNSMQGKIESGNTVVVAPVPSKMCPECEGTRFYEPGMPCIECGDSGVVTDLREDDIVLVKVKGKTYLHLIKAIKWVEDVAKYQIGNNKGGINGWVGEKAIYGVAVEVEGTVIREVNKEYNP